MTKSIRPAEKNDALHVAALIDLAGHGIEGEFWQDNAGEDLSAINAARKLIIEDHTLPYHYSKAFLLELDGQLAGGLIGGPIEKSAAIAAEFPPYFAPLLELETFVPDYWAIIGVAVYPEFRGRGLALDLLNFAKSKARGAHARGLSLVVEDTNEAAVAIYRRYGFSEVERRPWLSFAGRSGPKAWILMTRGLAD